VEVEQEESSFCKIPVNIMALLTGLLWDEKCSFSARKDVPDRSSKLPRSGHPFNPAKITAISEKVHLVGCDAAWIFLRTDVSEEHIASFIRVE
jgi:hypothetical protein